MAEKVSVRKMRRLRALLARHYKLPEPPDPQETMLDQVMMTVLWQDAPPAKARLAFVNLSEEFAGWNELRVSMGREIGDVLATCGLRRGKALTLRRVLARAVEDLYSFDFECLAERPRDQLKAWFVTIEGVPHSSAAAILYQVYRYNQVLVGPDIGRVMRRLGLVSETAPEDEIEKALNRVVPAKNAHSVHSALRRHALKVCRKTDYHCPKCVLRAECVAGKRRIAEIEAAEAAKAAARAARAKARARSKAKAARGAATGKAKRTSKGRAASKTAKKAAARPKRTPEATKKRVRKRV